MDELAKKREVTRVQKLKEREGDNAKQASESILIALNVLDLRDLAEVLGDEEIGLSDCVDEYYDHQETRRQRARRALRTLIREGKKIP